MSVVVPVSQIRNLPEVYREAAVTAYLTAARDRLNEALEATGPQAVAAIKAEVATVAEMTKQLGLSKECRDDATEMVRRAEYALGKAIRKGQEDGTVMRKGGPSRRDLGAYSNLVATSDLGSKTEIYGNATTGQAGVVTLAAADDSEFEEALTEARAEGNLSRANVARKIRQEGGPQTREQRADEIERLAREGYTSKQIAPKVGVAHTRVRSIARDYGIDIPADRATGKRPRLDANRILSGAADAVSAAAYSIQQIDPLDLDPEAAQEWVDSLTESVNALRKALNPIKESIRVQV